MHDDDQNKAIALGHEPIELSGRTVAKGFSVLYAVVFVSLLLMAGLMLLFSKIAGGEATVEAPPEQVAAPPGVPMLNSDQNGSLRTLRSRERKVLTEYAWIDQDAGIARIPIKRAMEMMSQSVNTSPEIRNDDPSTP